MLPTGGDSQSQPAALELDDLPSDILDKLLSGLPASDVVRTSVLSQTWRTRWESVPGLEIDLDGRVRDRDCDWDSAARFLERCAAPVGGVAISGVPLRLSRRIDGWVRTVVGKSPRALSLDLPMPVPLPSLFACSDPDALASLKLLSCVVPPPPADFAGFRALTALDLDYVIFPGQKGWERLEAMIAAAGSTLEKLRLANIIFIRDVADGGGLAVTVPPPAWIIQAPNVRRLELCLTMAAAGAWELAHFPKLDYALITLSDDNEPRDYNRTLLTALSNARELDIRNFHRCTYQVDGFTIMLNVSCTFENLRTLKLHTHFNEVSTILSNFSLLHQAPHLQVLEITDSSRHETNKEVHAFAENFLTTLANDGLVKNLEHLRMKSISCSPCDMHFIKYVLRDARNLQMASVQMFKGHWNSAFDASRMIKQFERASPAARICFEHGGYYCWLV